MANLNYNRILLAGRLTKDPAIKQTATGTYVATFSIAVNRNYKRKDGVTPTDFFDCIIFERRAELLCKWFSKGDLIMIEGELSTKEYISKDGIKRKSYWISVKYFYFVERLRKSSLMDQFNPMEINEDISDDMIPF